MTYFIARATCYMPLYRHIAYVKQMMHNVIHVTKYFFLKYSSITELSFKNIYYLIRYVSSIPSAL